MRIVVLLALTACGVAQADPFEQMTALAGEWQADLPGYGQILDSIRSGVEGRCGRGDARHAGRQRGFALHARWQAAPLESRALQGAS